MIFFSRWGFLLLPIFAVIGLFVGAVSNRLVGSDHGDITIIVAGLVAAGLTWKVGSVLNDPAKDRAVIDAKTGAHVKLKRRHSLMFIPIQYYALLFLLIAGLGLVSLMPELKAAMDEEQRNADAYANSHRSTVSAQPTAHTNATTTSGQNTPSAGSPTTRPTQSDASQTFSWTIKAEKDQMSGEVEKKAVGEVDLPDGTIAQGEATCSLFTLVFTISTFHGKTAVDFPWHGDTTSVRTRVDEQNIKTLTVTQENLRIRSIFWSMILRLSMHM
jgi:cytoskeletal protein RodZ